MFTNNKILCLTSLTLVTLLTACGSSNTDENAEAAPPEKETRVISHLKGESEVPVEIDKIVVLSAAYIDHLLTIEELPYGVNIEARYGGDYPTYLEDQLEGVHLVGSADEPNLEAITELNPDAILVESRTPDDTYDLLEQIAPTIVLGTEWLEYEEDPDFWTNDLLKIAELYDKVELAEEKIEELHVKTADAKQIVESLDNRKLAYLRIREDMIQIYAEGGHPMNTLLYEDLGFLPTDLTPKEQREDISLEAIPGINADYIMLEVDPSASNTIEEMNESELWKQIPAVHNNQTYETDSFWLFKGWGAIGRGQIIDEIIEVIE
ncbi:ABC transporter substrate-binding protein [Alkalicoccobacillus murimartini]|uniref:Iron complex transport system substrate-binding protein n=1 Tax=Alkalicoccobacillus murimartini TaxID=171685 RepID=A0ABT9YLL4_9BACI|nr:ABC transporter substrate-binding protein [Alkalicoccobacillus murimartini]MDQ0208733.1 iron complex transport system substrate-binding protein [Alkalicoccobacillus murimartini]